MFGLFKCLSTHTCFVYLLFHPVGLTLYLAFFLSEILPRTLLGSVHSLQIIWQGAVPESERERKEGERSPIGVGDRALGSSKDKQQLENEGNY